MSELAAMRQRIELECEAALRGLYSTRIEGPHNFIEHQFTSLTDQILVAHQQLANLVGKLEADKYLHSAFQKDWRDGGTRTETHH